MTAATRQSGVFSLVLDTRLEAGNEGKGGQRLASFRHPQAVSVALERGQQLINLALRQILGRKDREVTSRRRGNPAPAPGVVGSSVY